MADRTAFPWVPATRWQRDDRGPVTIWHVTIKDPSEHPAWIEAAHGKGATPTEALASLLQVVAWWLDYDGRRGGTAGQLYGDRKMLGVDQLRQPQHVVVDEVPF